MKAQDTCELFFDNVKVPKKYLLGEERMGFKIMMTELARERSTVALNSIGGAAPERVGVGSAPVLYQSGGYFR